MKIDRKYHPELIASDDFARPSINHVHFDAQEKKLVATNGHMLVAVPCQPEEVDSAGPVPAEALEHARKGAKKGKRDDMRVMANGKIEAGDGDAKSPVLAMERPDLGNMQFPVWRQIVPSFKPGDDGTITIGLNAQYLYDLAKALGRLERDANAMICLTILVPDSGHSPLEPMLIHGGAGKEEAFGVLMPCRTDIKYTPASCACGHRAVQESYCTSKCPKCGYSEVK